MNQKHTFKQQVALRSFAYGVMTIAVLAGVAFCLAWAMGFRFDVQSGQISQVSLLQFDSFPQGANIDVNGARLSSLTPTRVNIKSGQTTVTMSKSGYRSWSKTVDALPSSVRWLNYARLIPQNLTTDSVKSFANISQMVPSPDQHWLALQISANSRELTLANIANPLKVQFQTLTLDSSQIATPGDGQSETFRIVEWDQSSRYILLQHTIGVAKADGTIDPNGAATEYLELDRQNSDTTKNLTRDFNMTLSDPHFSGTSGNVFFALTGTDLRRFDYGSNSVSAPLISDVQNYRMYTDSRLAYVATSTSDGKQQQIVGIYNDGKTSVVKTYADVQPTRAEFANYDGTDYLAVARGDLITTYPNPLTNNFANTNIKPISLNSPGGIDQFGFSPNGRFVVASYANKIVSYDLETNEHFAFELRENVSSFNWLDDYHLVDTGGGQVSFVEFDGGNRETIVSGHGQATLSNDGKYLFSLANAAGSVVLQRSQMVLN